MAHDSPGGSDATNRGSQERRRSEPPERSVTTAAFRDGLCDPQWIARQRKMLRELKEVIASTRRIVDSTLAELEDLECRLHAETIAVFEHDGAACPRDILG
jgi:hypothetical protein